ncbi:MAG: YihY/virulence factor BrkB family protein [Bacteroidota bacterium]
MLGFVTLALGASGMFVQIHNAFNSIWNIKRKPGKGMLRYLTQHLASLGLLIGLFFLLILSTLIHSLLKRYSENLSEALSHWHLLEHGISLIVFSLIFALMFKFLGDAKIRSKALILGGIITALLFTFGKLGIGYYLGQKHLNTTFGSASVLALLMLWVYYTSQILFLGASFIEVISQRLGYAIRPKSNATKVQTLEVADSTQKEV